MMTLKIDQLIPLPLGDRLRQRDSGIWLRRLEWRQGEHIQLLAPSGSGKTTLVHILYGLRHDYEGSVSWNGTDIRGMNGAALSGLRAEGLSIIFQDLRLFPELTTRENLELKRALTGTVAPGKTDEWMERLGIKHKADAPAHTLSYGEQQRAAIIRALLQPFKWLLMDEPFSHLDRANALEAAALIREAAQERNAALLLAGLDGDDYFEYTKTLRL